jgi:hypothetical protein
VTQRGLSRDAAHISCILFWSRIGNCDRPFLNNNLDQRCYRLLRAAFALSLENVCRGILHHYLPYEHSRDRMGQSRVRPYADKQRETVQQRVSHRQAKPSFWLKTQLPPYPPLNRSSSGTDLSGTAAVRYVCKHTTNKSTGQAPFFAASSANIQCQPRTASYRLAGTFTNLTYGTASSDVVPYRLSPYALPLVNGFFVISQPVAPISRLGTCASVTRYTACCSWYSRRQLRSTHAQDTSVTMFRTCRPLGLDGVHSAACITDTHSTTGGLQANRWYDTN